MSSRPIDGGKKLEIEEKKLSKFGIIRASTPEVLGGLTSLRT